MRPERPPPAPDENSGGGAADPGEDQHNNDNHDDRYPRGVLGGADRPLGGHGEGPRGRPGLGCGAEVHEQDVVAQSPGQAAHDPQLLRWAGPAVDHRDADVAGLAELDDYLFAADAVEV